MKTTVRTRKSIYFESWKFLLSVPRQMPLSSIKMLSLPLWTIGIPITDCPIARLPDCPNYPIGTFWQSELSPPRLRCWRPIGFKSRLPDCFQPLITSLHYCLFFYIAFVSMLTHKYCCLLLCTLGPLYTIASTGDLCRAVWNCVLLCSMAYNCVQLCTWIRYKWI